eukprot:9326729-Pyramimonas_sp.AAC.1
MHGCGVTYNRTVGCTDVWTDRRMRVFMEGGKYGRMNGRTDGFMEVGWLGARSREGETIGDHNQPTRVYQRCCSTSRVSSRRYLQVLRFKDASPVGLPFNRELLRQSHV